MKRTSAESRRPFRPGGSDFVPARFPHMRAFCFFLLAGLLAPAQASADWMLRRVASIPSGRSSASGDVLCGDTDHDSLAEVIFANWEGARTWQFWECAPMNQYRLVKSDTFRGGERHGLDKGMFLPNALGDIDDDGLTDILGSNYEDFSPDSYHFCICVYESPDVHSYPDTLVWSYCYSNEGYNQYSWLPGDLDQDGRKEILLPWDSTLIFETRGENQYEPVAGTCRQHVGYDYAFGDFDRDGHNEFATVEPFQRPHPVIIYRCTGDDRYALADSSIPPYYNGYDLWSGDDLDQDGRPEFYVGYSTNVGQPWWEYTLCMYEAVTPDSYERLTIDSVYHYEDSDGENSACADIDLDGIQEVVWSFNGGVRIFKATGNNQFARVWNWWTQWMPNRAYVTCHDMNGNGYPDIVISGTDHTWMMELEAIRIRNPNAGVLVAGDTCRIRWDLFEPPRCDSVSLFLRRDTAWRLDTIVTGLSPAESSYAWVVPDLRLDSCHIVAIAYGPGWQYDESDTALAIIPSGIAQGRNEYIRETRLLSVLPNPVASRASVRFQTKSPGPAEVVIRDVSGRERAVLLRSSIPAGTHEVGWDATELPCGVYFLSFATPDHEENRKLVINR